MRSFPFSTSGDTFSRREIEILGLIAEGFSNHTIALKLYLSLTTVKWYNQQIFSKLGVNSRTQAIARAREMGLFAHEAGSARQEAARPKHNLPAALTSYIGREKERADLLGLLTSGSRRLVTITGAGGVGKTRLALRVAEEALRAFPHGAWLVDLSTLSDPTLVAQHVAHSLGWRDEVNIPYEELLIRVLKPRNLLLLLDNCEHLVGACARLVDMLLKACPKLHILATSREAMGVAGEAFYPITTLSFPDPDHLPPLESIQQYEAVQLFGDRAVLVFPGFVINQENAHAMAQLCQRLDGMPLALELAAARANLLSLPQMVERLNGHLLVLTASTREPLSRHRSLQACIDWSYALLSEKERLLLHRLSAFVGAWTMEAAEAVCSDPPGGAAPSSELEPAAILDLLSGLVNKSLVVASMGAGAQPGQEMRYRMLDTIHAYAHEKLVESGEETSLRDRHLTYFARFVEQIAPRLKSAEQPERLRQLEAERENLRAAMSWALVERVSGQEDALNRIEMGLHMGNGLAYFWDGSSLFPGVINWLSDGLARLDALVPDRKALRARTLYTLGVLNRVVHNYAGARQAWEESIELLRECGDLPTLSLALADLSWLLVDFDHPVALSLVRESEAAARQAGNPWNLAYALLVSMAVNGGVERDDRLALAYGQESLALFRATGDPWKLHWTQTILASIIVRQGDKVGRNLWTTRNDSREVSNKELGRAYLDESGRFFRQLESIRGKVFYTHILGTTSYFLEDFHQMVDCFQEALQGFRELGIRGFSDTYLRYLGTAYKRLEEYDRSAAYFWECISSVQAVDVPGILYMALAGMGGVAAEVGQPLRAVHLLGAAERSFEGPNMYGEDIFLKEFERDTTLARGQLDDAAFAAAWAEGREMSLEEAIGEARLIFESVTSQVPKT